VRRPPTDALIVVDVQADFLPGGALAVPQSDALLAPINALIPAFSIVTLTQDWHPPGHASFASSHPGAKPFETRQMSYGPQVLWPDHCVQASEGAALSPALSAACAQLIVRKGFHPGVDSYSAFLEADHTTHTGLAGYLRERGVTRVFVCGLATDYCVGATAIDAREAGFEAVVVEDACRAIDQQGSLAAAWRAMAAAGVTRASTSSVI